MTAAASHGDVPIYLAEIPSLPPDLAERMELAEQPEHGRVAPRDAFEASCLVRVLRRQIRQARLAYERKHGPVFVEPPFAG